MMVFQEGVMTNEQLTAQYNLMVQSLAVMENKLETVIPTMDNMNTDTQNPADDIKSKLKSHVEPIINADVFNNIVKLDRLQLSHSKKLDEQIAELKDEPTKVRELTSDDVVNAKLVNGQASAQILSLSQRADALQQVITNVGHEFAAEKTASDVRYASTQSQIATIHASASSSGGTGHKTGEPIVCHKLMRNKNPLSGEEDYNGFDEWYADMADVFEIILPGSKLIMQDAEKRKTPMTMNDTMNLSKS